MKRLSLEQAARNVLEAHEPYECKAPCDGCMVARAVLEAARWRRNTREELVQEMWSAMRRAARGKG